MNEEKHDNETAASVVSTPSTGAAFVACPGWRWMPGMLAACNRPRARTQLTRVDEYSLIDGKPCNEYWEPEPDVNDPATLGCIEHGLLPEAWGP